MKFVGLVVFTALCIGEMGAHAATPSDVRRTLRSIRQELQFTRASDRELDTVVAHLDSAYHALRNARGGGGGADNGQCFQFAYAAYAKSYSSGRATEKATEACRIIVDLAVARVLYNYASRSYSSGQAMDVAANGANYDTSGKVEIIEYAATNYSRSYSSGEAAKKAAAGASTVRVGSLPCLQRTYPGFARSYSSGKAMDKAFTACR